MQIREQYGEIVLSILDRTGRFDDILKDLQDQQIYIDRLTYSDDTTFEIALLRDREFVLPSQIGLPSMWDELWGQDEVAGYVDIGSIDQIREHLRDLYGESR